MFSSVGRGERASVHLGVQDGFAGWYCMNPVFEDRWNCIRYTRARGTGKGTTSKRNSRGLEELKNRVGLGNTYTPSVIGVKGSRDGYLVHVPRIPSRVIS